MQRRNLASALAASLGIATATGVVTALPASAATGCTRHLPGEQPMAGRFRGQRHRQEPRRPGQLAGPLVWSYAAGQTVDPGLERHRHPERLAGHRQERELQRLARHQREHVVRLQRLVDRQQPGADQLHPERHGLHRRRRPARPA